MQVASLYPLYPYCRSFSGIHIKAAVCTHQKQWALSLSMPWQLKVFICPSEKFFPLSSAFEYIPQAVLIQIICIRHYQSFLYFLSVASGFASLKFSAIVLRTTCVLRNTGKEFCLVVKHNILVLLIIWIDISLPF